MLCGYMLATSPVRIKEYYWLSKMCWPRLGGKDGGPADRDSHAMQSGSADSPSAASSSLHSSDLDSTPTAAAPAYPSDASTSMGSSTQIGQVPNPAPPPPGSPRQAHAEYQKLLQQRHRERLNLHKNQVGLMFCQYYCLGFQKKVSQVSGSCFWGAPFLIAMLAGLNVSLFILALV